MRSAVETRCGPSASTSSSSEIIELCAARSTAATTSRASLRTGAAIAYSSGGELLVIDGEAGGLDLVELVAQRFLGGDRVGAAFGELHLGDHVALL